VIHLTRESHARSARRTHDNVLFLSLSLPRAGASNGERACFGRLYAARMPRAGHDPGKFEPHSDG
jgi:hypothetical protein